MDQANRPRTRGLEASEAEEDAKYIKAALADPSKFIKKAHQKLRSDYGGGRGRNAEESDEEEKLFYRQPAYDDDEAEVKPGTKRRRGMWRRGNVRKKAKGGGGDGGGAMEDDVRRPQLTARMAAFIQEELKPKIIPYNKSTIEYKLVWYRLGDIVSMTEDETTYFAQILGFHTDQFCERYVSIRWLLPKYKFDCNDPHQPPVTADSFRGSVSEDRTMNMKRFRFVLRPPAYHFAPDNPNVVTRNNYYVYRNVRVTFDSPTQTLTSAYKRY